MLVDHVSNLSPSEESVVFLSTLLLDTYSFSEVNMRVEELFFNADAIIASSISWSGKSVLPAIDRDVINSSIDCSFLNFCNPVRSDLRIRSFRNILQS